MGDKDPGDSANSTHNKRAAQKGEKLCKGSAPEQLVSLDTLIKLPLGKCVLLPETYIRYNEKMKLLKT